MIHIKLPYSMMLDTQLADIDRIANATNGGTFAMDPNGVCYDLMNGMSVAFLDDSGFDGVIKAFTTDDNNVAHLTFNPDEKPFLFGAEAVKMLLYESRAFIPNFALPFTDIEIPFDVALACDPEQWYEITYLVGRLMNRCERIRKLKDLDAPIIIMLNEYRMLYEAVCALEHNYKDSETHERVRRFNGKPFTSLNDVGYSMLTGFDLRTPERKLLDAIFSNADEDSEDA